MNNHKVEYTLLITVLEALFNRSRDQITHVIARHLAILIAENEQDFQDKYKEIKNLYGLRSKIVHGTEINKRKDDIIESLKKVRNYVRLAIYKCLETGKTSKDDLFNYLNTQGI